MHVRIDRNSGLLEGEGYYNVGGLPAHAGQREKRLQVRWHFAPEDFQQSFTDGVNRPRLHSIERNRIDRIPNDTNRCRQHFLRSVRDGEQPVARGICGSVLRPEAEDARDQNCKRSFHIMANRRYGPLPAFLSQYPDDLMDVFRVHIRLPITCSTFPSLR